MSSGRPPAFTGREAGRTTRRQFLQLAAGAGVASRAALAAIPDDGRAAGPVVAQLTDGTIRLELDPDMRLRVWRLAAGSTPLTPWSAPDVIELVGGRSLDRFHFTGQERASFEGPHGPGVRLTLSGIASEPRIEKRLVIEVCERYPGVAFCRVSFRNLSSQTLGLCGWTASRVRLPHGARADGSEPEFWSYCGSTHADRRDWVQPVKAGFAQDNFMGMTASDYGGGTPVVDVWRRDAGLAVGHLELHPLLVSLPVRYRDGAVDLAVVAQIERALTPGASLETPTTFIAVHGGDYFATLDAYRRIMADRGLHAPVPPPAAYEGIWCAWGYERNCTLELIENTLPKVRELGLGWAVVDDGWQSNVGDWKLDAK